MARPEGAFRGRSKTEWAVWLPYEGITIVSQRLEITNMGGGLRKPVQVNIVWFLQEKKAVLPWFVQSIFVWRKLLRPVVLHHWGKECCPLGAVLVASLSPDSLRVEYTCPQEVISQKIPTLRNYSHSQCWLWFSPWLLFKRLGVLVSLLWQVALSFLWFRTLMKMNLEWNVIEGQLHLMARSIRTEQCCWLGNGKHLRQCLGNTLNASNVTLV